MRDRGRSHRLATTGFSIAMVVIGIALVVRTIAAGGAADATGIVLGALFMFAGVARLYVQSRQP